MTTKLGASEIALKIHVILDTLLRSSLSERGNPVRAILAALTRDDLSPAEVMSVLEELKRRGQIGRFLNLVSHRDLRAYLQQKRVAWGFVLEHWEPSLDDTARILAGMGVGAASRLTDALSLLWLVMEAPIVSPEAFIKGLRSSASSVRRALHFIATDGLRAALRRLTGGAIALGAQLFREHLKRIETLLWELRFYEFGHILGEMLAEIVVSFGSLVRSPARLTRALHAMQDDAVQLAQISLVQAQQLGVRAQALVDFAASPLPHFVTTDGIVLTMARGNVGISSAAGKPLGLLSRAEAAHAELAAARHASRSHATWPRVKYREDPKGFGYAIMEKGGVAAVSGKTIVAELLKGKSAIAASAAGTLVGKNRSGFRDAIERILRDQPSHPLRFLLDKDALAQEQYRLRNSSAKGITAEIRYVDRRLVEAGHTKSAWIGGETTILMSSSKNRHYAATLEHTSKGGALLDVEGVLDIDGIAVDAELVADWLDADLISLEAARRAIPILLHR